MAQKAKSVTDNVPGEFFVDNTCINCGACRSLAPRVFADGGPTSFVAAQPATEAERFQSFQALLACPVNSIGAVSTDPVTGAITSTKTPKEVHPTFPMRLDGDAGAAARDVRVPLPDGVYYNGFNARQSFGADSYFIHDAAGNWLVDSPRFHPHLLERFQKSGGLNYIFLTHRDDVADANKYATEFGAKRIIHERDLRACPDAEIVLNGAADRVIGDARMIFTPGHTQGHAVLLWKNRFLFTGDHLPWNSAAKALRPFADACWYSWEEQIASVEKLAGLDHVTQVLPGHGERWATIAPGLFPSMIREAATWMRTRNSR